MLIPVPLLPKETAGSDLLRRVRILQENIGRQKTKEANAERLPVDGELQTVQFKNGKIMLPDACGPQIDLEVGDVSQIQIWDEFGQFGSGPLIYTMPNLGETMAGAEFGYHVEWVIIDEGERKVIKENQWYACTGWDQDQLTCTGPDWLKYDSAQMCIYYEDPACQLPVQCFIFNGDDAFPKQNKQACEQEDVHFRIESIETDSEHPVWYFWTDDAQPYDNKYILKITTEDVITLDYMVYAGTTLRGTGPDPEEHPNLKWEILRVPEDVCTDVLTSGTMGEGAIEQAKVDQPAPVCDQNVTVTLWSTSPNNTGDTTNWVFKVNPPENVDPRVEQFPDFWLKTWSDNGLEEITDDCQAHAVGEIVCEGWNPTKFGEIEWEVESKEDNCEKPLAYGKSGPLSSTANSSPEDSSNGSDEQRCEIFDGLSMSTIFLEWQPGTPLTFYLKIPGGVPGLERNITGDEDAWHYKAKIGGYTTDGCNYEGYKERLYCRISLPSEYSSSIQPLDININGCDIPIYTDQRTELPDILGKSSSGGSNDGSSSGSSGSGPVSCAGGSGCPSGYYCDTMYDLCVPQ